MKPLREEIKALPIVERFKTELGEYMTDEYLEDVYALFEKVLQSLEMEEVDPNNLTSKERAEGFNSAVRKNNTKIAQLIHSLKEDK